MMTLHRRRLLWLAGAVSASAAGLLVASRLQAQTADKVFRIGYLAPSPELSAIDRTRLDTLRASLRQLGWVEGRNLQIETRHACAHSRPNSRGWAWP